MKLNFQSPGNGTEARDKNRLNDFRQADNIRGQAIELLTGIENFYQEKLAQFPDRCEFDLAHDRGKIEGMIWQTQQLKSLTTLFFSQAGQDRFLDAYIFDGRKNGTFVEIGGYDGVTGSNCLFFESIRRWNGLMIEPSPGPMGHARLFRNCELIEAAVGPEAGTADFVNIKSGLTQMSGLRSMYQENELGGIRAHPAHQEEVITVQTRRLEDILRQYGLKDIDYCSLDVEGAELPILASFPFDEFNISVWSIENNRQTTDIAEVMLENGYRFLTVLGVDEFYQKIT